MAAMLPRKTGGGCGIHFDARGMQFVRVTRMAPGGRLRVDAYGSAVFEDGMLNGAQIAKPEAVARRLEEMLERLGMRVDDLQDDTIVLALPSYGLKTQVIDRPPDLPPRALRAWCERRAAMLVPGDGGGDSRSRVGVTWADPGSHRLRLYACEAALVDDRLAVLELAGLRAHAIDAAHKAAHRAFRWAMREVRVLAPHEPWAAAERSGIPVALVQIDAHDIDLAVFDARGYVADVRERLNGTDGHPEALASAVRDLLDKLSVAPLTLYVVAQQATASELAAICESVGAVCAIAVHPFDPFGSVGPRDPSDRSGRSAGWAPSSNSAEGGEAVEAVGLRF
ncbi:hypothetical protein AB870_09660 [Pandoraea faecigallinarum]|uniref:Uncharacterized protein n=2 Tax=Pandoraea faecigallinarum TaxID=656179 RepID=A0A0H3WQ68_9BURK|nr:hypothetical protein AB870_09660 [Pandoraea faecigallinarum]